MAATLLLLYHCFAFLSLFFLGLYHLVFSIRSFLRPNQSPYSARPYHPLPLPPHRHHLLRHLPLILSLFSILLSVTYHLFYSFSSSSSSSSFSSSAHTFSSLRVVVSLLLFLFLLLPYPIPSELTFLLASLSFYLLSFLSSSSSSLSSSSSSSSEYTDLESKCESVGSTISLASAGFSLALALFPRLFLADVALSASLLLRGLWALQTGLTLYVEAFVPEGCHLLLDLPEPSTRCDLEESKMRAAELLDLAFALHSAFVAAVVIVAYVAVAKGSGPAAAAAIGGLRRSNNGSYEALPTSSASTGALADLDHVQMKAIGKSSAQA